ncbi:MAG: hypothetical protein ACUVRU_01625 [Anaerolineae bacterium]
MPDRALIYISAASDLMAEREAVSQLIPAVPTSLGWRVVQTPLDDREPDLDVVVSADVHLLLLGSDVRAPVGLEWQAARRVGRVPALFSRSEGLRTQAGEAFARELARYGEWRPFKDELDLRQQVAALLVDHLVASAARYAILPNEIDRLLEWKKTQRATKPKPALAGKGGAQAGGVILSRERFMPSQGRLIGQKE